MTARDAAERRAADRRREIATFAAGLAFLAVVVASVVGIYDAFNGDFSTYVEVKADLPVGQPAELHSQVQFRQVQVGQVGGVDGALPGGAIEVTLQIKPDRLAGIPADVQASVAPSSLFGTETVVLSTPPAGPPPGAGGPTGPGLASTPGNQPAAGPGGHLRPGAVVPAAGGSASLQGTLTDLNHLLTGLHPAQIDTTLGALSTALQGQGQAAGDAIHALDSYLNDLIPQLPTLNGDIDLLTPVLDGLSASVPALLDVAANSGQVARTLTDYQSMIAAAFSEGAQLSGTGAQLLDTVGASLHAFLANLQPLLGDLNAQPDLPAHLLTAINALTTSFLPALSSSAMPAANVRATDYVNSPYEAYLAGANLPGISPRQDQQEAHAAFAATVDPPTYTAADCPHYGTEPGPNCPGPAVPPATHQTAAAPQAGAAAATAAAPAGRVIAALTADQQAAVAQLFTALAGHPPAQAATAEVILAPLIQSLAP